MVKNFAFAALVALFGTAALADSQPADQKDQPSAEANKQDPAADTSNKAEEDASKKDDASKK